MLKKRHVYIRNNNSNGPVRSHFVLLLCFIHNSSLYTIHSSPGGHQMGSCVWRMRRPSESGAQQEEDVMNGNVHANNSEVTHGYFSSKNYFFKLCKQSYSPPVGRLHKHTSLDVDKSEWNVWLVFDGLVPRRSWAQVSKGWTWSCSYFSESH